MIKKYERIIAIEAIRFLDNKKSFDEIRAWVGDDFYYDYQNPPWVFLLTDTSHPVREDDWVVKKDGKFSVMSDADMSYFTKIKNDTKAISKD
jgi:hypothetical protein